MKFSLFFPFGFIIIFAIIAWSISYGLGIGGFGPTNQLTVKVLKTYVDISKDDEGGSSSHYMVMTDKGSFEVDNGILLGMWNADDVFGKLEVGKTYTITTKGRRYQNAFMQEMPYITSIKE